MTIQISDLPEEAREAVTRLIEAADDLVLAASLNEEARVYHMPIGSLDALVGARALFADEVP